MGTGRRWRSTSRLLPGKPLGPQSKEDERMTTLFSKGHTDSLKEKRTKSPTNLGQAVPMVGPQVQQPPTPVLRLRPASLVEENSQSPIHKVATGHAYIYGVFG